MFYVFEGNASSSASLECCTVKLEQPFGQFPVGYTGVIQDGHRADQYPEVGFSPAIDHSLLARFSVLF